MHNLLADETVTGSDAIAMTALEYGLVEPEFVQSMNENSSFATCCVHAAHQIMDRYFETRKKSANQQVDVERAWSSVLNETHKYLLNKTGDSIALAEFRDTDVNNGICKGNSAKQSGLIHDCNKVAPVIFDLLLQEIRRYP